MTGSHTPASDFLQQVDRVTVQSQVRRFRGKPGVLAIRAVPRWEGAEAMDVDGEPVTVLACATTLAVRDGLTRRRAVSGRLVVLTDLTDEQLGDGIREHLVGRRVRYPDPWQALRDRFGATTQEYALMTGTNAARAALGQLADVTRPPVAVGGVLTRDLLFETLLGAALGLTGATTVVDLLHWSGRPDADPRFAAWRAGTHPDLQQEVFGWLGARWGQPAVGLLAALRSGRPPSDLIPIGLIADIVRGTAESDREAHVVLRTRLESVVAASLPGPALNGWASSAVLAADQLADESGAALAVLLRRADSIGAELRIGEQVECSDYLPAALDARLERLATAVSDLVGTWSRRDRSGLGLMDAVEAAWNRVVEHVTVAGRTDDGWPRDVQLAHALVRLLRYRAIDRPDLRTLDQAVQWYRNTGSWVDAAVNDAFTGSDRAALASVAHRVLQRVRAERVAQDRSAAGLVASGAVYSGGRGAGSPLLIEDILERVVLPLTAAAAPGGSGAEDGRGSVLLVIADGMSCAAAGDIVVDLTRRHASVWQQVDVVEGDRRLDAAVAVLPTVTELSRTSLLSGTLATGTHTEPSGFDGWLTAHSRGSGAQTLFRKGDIEAVSAGHALPSDLRTAIDDVVHRPVVACVLNAIDDALDRSDPIGTRWTTGTLHPLDALLHAAGRVGRTVVLTSDHGHVVERREQDRQRGEAISARWRPANSDVSVADDEVLVEGDRVLTENRRAVLAVDEQVRYTRLKAGYHGGAALAEVVVPIMVLVPGEIPAHLPLKPAGAVPTWWVGAESLTRAVSEPLPSRASTAGAGPRADAVREGPPTLFDDPDRSATPTDDSVQRVLATKQFVHNRALFAPQLPAEQIGRLLRALIAAGGTLGRPQAGAALGVADRRLAGTLAVVSQVLNVDGVVVLSQTGIEVTLVDGLLYEQFGVTP